MIGTGYVGLVTGTCFSDSGNDVTCVDIDSVKIEKLRHGEIPIYEPGLTEMVLRNVSAGRLQFTTDLANAVDGAQCVFVAVGTPQGDDGSADLNGLWKVIDSLATCLKPETVVVIKSTVPVGTGDWVADIVSRTQPQPIEFAVVSNPEFLRESTAVRDYYNPPKIVVGEREPGVSRRGSRRRRRR